MFDKIHQESVEAVIGDHDIRIDDLQDCKVGNLYSTEQVARKIAENIQKCKNA